MGDEAREAVLGSQDLTTLILSKLARPGLSTNSYDRRDWRDPQQARAAAERTCRLWRACAQALPWEASVDLKRLRPAGGLLASLAAWAAGHHLQALTLSPTSLGSEASEAAFRGLISSSTGLRSLTCSVNTAEHVHLISAATALTELDLDLNPGEGTAAVETALVLVPTPFSQLTNLQVLSLASAAQRGGFTSDERWLDAQPWLAALPGLTRLALQSYRGGGGLALPRLRELDLSLPPGSALEPAWLASRALTALSLTSALVSPACQDAFRHLHRLDLTDCELPAPPDLPAPPGPGFSCGGGPCPSGFTAWHSLTALAWASAAAPLPPALEARAPALRTLRAEVALDAAGLWQSALLLPALEHLDVVLLAPGRGDEDAAYYPALAAALAARPALRRFRLSLPFAEEAVVAALEGRAGLGGVLAKRGGGAEVHSCRARPLRGRDRRAAGLDFPGFVDDDTLSAHGHRHRPHSPSSSSDGTTCLLLSGSGGGAAPGELLSDDEEDDSDLDWPF